MTPERRAADPRGRFAPVSARTHSGGSHSPAITRVREAVAEIKKAAKKEPVLAAEGAVLFLERVSSAIEHVDGSSGSMGSAVNRAIEELVPIVANAPADVATREAWLERLHVAHGEDRIPYIETLGEHWGELCVSKDIASRWADRELAIVRHALSPEREKGGIYHGTTACLAALFRAERHRELVDLLGHAGFWPYKRWAVKALDGTRDDRIAAGLAFAPSRIVAVAVLPLDAPMLVLDDELRPLLSGRISTDLLGLLLRVGHGRRTLVALLPDLPAVRPRLHVHVLPVGLPPARLGLRHLNLRAVRLTQPHVPATGGARFS